MPIKDGLQRQNPSKNIAKMSVRETQNIDWRRDLCRRGCGAVAARSGLARRVRRRMARGFLAAEGLVFVAQPPTRAGNGSAAVAARGRKG